MFLLHVSAASLASVSHPAYTRVSRGDIGKNSAIGGETLAIYDADLVLMRLSLSFFGDIRTLNFYHSFYCD